MRSATRATTSSSSRRGQSSTTRRSRGSLRNTASSSRSSVSTPRDVRVRPSSCCRRHLSHREVPEHLRGGHRRLRAAAESDAHPLWRAEDRLRLRRDGEGRRAQHHRDASRRTAGVTCARRDRREVRSRRGQQRDDHDGRSSARAARARLADSGPRGALGEARLREVFPRDASTRHRLTGARSRVGGGAQLSSAARPARATAHSSSNAAPMSVATASRSLTTASSANRPTWSVPS